MSAGRLRIVFLGSGAFGVPTLEHLARHHDLVGVVSQPDRPAGRGRDLTPTPVSAWARAHAPGVPMLTPANINEPSHAQAVRAWGGDAWVVIAFGQKLGEPLLEGRFAINLHASLLPRWRGAAPINAAILAGDVETGNSVITLASRMDAGLVLAQSRRPIDPLVTAGELYDLLAADGPALVERVLHAHASGTLCGQTQDEALVTKARKLSRADAAVDFARPADEIRRQVHGLTPWPGVSLAVGSQSLKLLRVREIAPAEPTAHRGASPPAPGTLVDPQRGLIACGAGTFLQLLEVQPAGGRAMDWPALARGRTFPVGTVARTA